MELEIEIQGCSHMILNPETLKKPLINLNAEGATNIDMGEIRFKSEEDAVCKLTEKPCVLSKFVSNLHSIHLIRYHHRERCPSFEDSTKKYMSRGVKDGFIFYFTRINRLEDKK